MSKEIEGITVKFGANTAEFDNSVHGINKGLKLVKSEFKSINNDLKINPKSIDTFNAKLRNLGQQLDLVKKRNGKYVEALNELGKRTDANANLFDDLTRKIMDGDAEIKRLTNSIQNLNTKIESLKFVKFEELGKSLKNVGAHIENVGKALAPLSALSGGLLAKSARDAIEFESAFAGVEKTVDATEPQLQKLKQGIVDLSSQLPSTTTEISAVAESAGQLGIKTEDILDFTETMIGLGSATNLTADEASSMIAQFANVTGMTSDYDKLGSALVALGNNGASTEADIMALAQRLGGAGTTAGLTEQEILALSASMANVGINAEAGGTSMSTWISDISMAVAKGGEHLQGFLDVSNMTANEFKNLWNNDPTKVIDELLKGLNRIDKEGGNSLLALSSIGVEGTRMRDMVLRLANAEGQLSKNVELANNSWDENSALSTEVNKRNETMASQLQISKNLMTAISQTLGQNLAPLLAKFNELVKGIYEKFTQLSPEQQKLITQILMFTTALAPVLLIVGKLTTRFGGLMTKIKPLMSMIKTFVMGLSPLNIAIGALVALIAYAIMTNDGLRQSLMNIWSQIQTALMPILNALGVLVQTTIIPMFNAFIAVVDWLSQNVLLPLAQFIEQFLMPIISYLAESVGNSLSDVFTSFGTIVEFVIGLFEKLFAWTGDLWEKFKETQWVQDLINWFGSLRDMANKVIEAIKGIGDWMSNVIDKAASFASSVGSFIGGIFSSGGLGINAELMASGGLGIRNLTVNAPINVNNQGQPIGVEQVNGWIEQIADGVSVVLGRRLI